MARVPHGKPGGHDARQMSLSRRDQSSMTHCWQVPRRVTSETESRRWGRGWGRGEGCLMGTGFQFGRMESSGDGRWGRLHANAISALTGTLKVEMVNFMLRVFCQSRTERRQNKPKPEEPLREAGSVCAGSPAGACPRHMGRLWPGCTTGHPASSQLPPPKARSVPQSP